MVERGGGACLLLETAHSFFVPCEGSRQELESDLTAQPRVTGKINLTHPARTE
jgi:hypothetical protein